MDTAAIMDLLERGTRDLQWLARNRRALEVQHDEQFVAIKDQAVIAADKDMNHLLASIEAQGIAPGEVLIEFISKVARIL